MSASGTGNAKFEDLLIRERRRDPNSQETRLEIVQRRPPRSEGVSLHEGIVTRASVISIDDIYRAPEAGTDLGTALRLLRDALSSCAEALALVTEDPIRSDSAMLKVRLLLPELFCCRAIGDGFAEIINAIQSAYENLAGGIFSSSQIEAIRVALDTARNEPRMSFEKAMGYVSAMEEVDLRTEPSNVDALADWLDE